MLWYGMVYVNLYSANVSNALRTPVPRQQPSFQALFEGAKVQLCVEIVGQRVPNHRAVHSECSAANSGECSMNAYERPVTLSTCDTTRWL